MQRVLIIEDEPDMVLGLRDNFEFEGYDVLVASDGSEGLRRAMSDNPDVILLDIMLPRMSGLDVCRQLRSQGVETPIIDEVYAMLYESKDIRKAVTDLLSRDTKAED